MLDLWSLVPIRQFLRNLVGVKSEGQSKGRGLRLICPVTWKFRGSSLGLSFPPKLGQIDL